MAYRDRRLKARLKGSNHWDEFETTGVARPIWGGIANLDEIVGDSPSGALRGLILRLFDPASRQWRLYRANADRGILDQPMIGGYLVRKRRAFGDIRTYTQAQSSPVPGGRLVT